MAKDKTTVRFWLRNDKPDKDGYFPIHLVYQIQGQRKYYNVPAVKLIAVNWDLGTQRAVYRDKKTALRVDPKCNFKLLLENSEVSEINSNLTDLIKDISDIETRYRLDKISFSAAMVIDALKVNKEPETKKEQPGHNVVDFINQFVKESIGTHAPGTLKVYSGLAAHLSAFEKQTKTKVTFGKMDAALLRSFQGFLSQTKYWVTSKGKKIERSMNNVTAAKQISTLKTLLNYARTIYKIPLNLDYRDFKVSRKDSEFEVISLTQDEFMSVFNLDLTGNNKLDAVRDIFCFSCATGLRFSDLKQLKREHIKKDFTLRMTAAKTGQQLIIPLNPFSNSILQKYKNRPYPLPLISNQKMNDYIKEIGEKAKIDTPIEKVRLQGVKKVSKIFKKYKLLSIHVGRKSFITLSLEKGIPMQDVMALSGHTTFRAFKRYVDVNDKRKKTVMADAWGKVGDSNLKVV